MFLIDAALAEAAVWQQRIPIILGVGQMGHAQRRSEIFPSLLRLPLSFCFPSGFLYSPKLASSTASWLSLLAAGKCPMRKCLKGCLTLSRETEQKIGIS